MNTQTRLTYLDEDQRPYLFCPGCGHGFILDYLNKALVRLNIDPHKLVIITDIGCAGLSDRYFSTNAFHGLHGRSLTYASGIKMADPELTVIVLIGDGGCGIGGHHLLNAARRNIGVTVLVFNNLNYGMTGGEHSVTTPPGSVTSTTRFGQLEQPLDICGTVAINGASFVARTTTFDKGTPDLIVSAIQNKGFSLIDIWELCTAHYVPNNRFSKKALEDTLGKLSFPTGIIVEKSKPEYSTQYQAVHAEIKGQPALIGNPIPTKYPNNLSDQKEIILAGAAGAKIASAASSFCMGAILSGLEVSKRDDYPVTVKSGHSIAEIIISPNKITFSSITKPNLMVILFPEGLIKSKHLINILSKKDYIILSSDLPEVDTLARKIIIDFNKAGMAGRKMEYREIMALTVAIKLFDYYPLDAFKAAIQMRSSYANENLAAVEAIEEFDMSSYPNSFS
jgi:pyruvate/2-oxoacid:ferredoxin oxidoreductase beta subunit/Pyruvate/2-oxoacid:ferredoxin oxidoreductase gamma subunit